MEQHVHQYRRMVVEILIQTAYAHYRLFSQFTPQFEPRGLVDFDCQLLRGQLQPSVDVGPEHNLLGVSRHGSRHAPDLHFAPLLDVAIVLLKEIAVGGCERLAVGTKAYAEHGAARTIGRRQQFSRCNFPEASRRSWRSAGVYCQG